MYSLVIGALLCALAADPTHDKSSTENNSANREATAPPTDDQEMSKVPGEHATPKSEWRTGDSRGKTGDRNRGADEAQQGSRGGNAVGPARTGPPAGGLDYGDANGMAGGRTDRGPRGETGLRERDTTRRDKKRSRANSQARAPNRKGSLQRPAETPPQRNDNPQVIGSGAPMTPVQDEPQPQGRNYVEGPQPGAAGGIASGTQSQPAAASPKGSSGHGAQDEPDKKPSTGTSDTGK
jgi:hypothetical protein